MRKIKVLHIITRLANGGADENTLYTINGLDKNKYDIDLMIGEENDQEMIENLELSNNINLYKIDGLVRNISPFNEVKAFYNIYKVIKNNSYDLVHTHIAKAGVLGRLAAKIAGVPTIVHGIHGITFPETINPIKRYFFKNIEKFCGLFTDKFIPVGEDMKNKYIKAGIGNREKYKTIYSGMELEKFKNAANNSKDKIRKLKSDLGLNDKDIIIGNVSKIQERKGYKYYLQVAKNISNEYDNVKFLIVGSGPHKDIIEKKVKSMNLSNIVIFTGFRKDVEDVFSLFDIKVLTSLWEGLPRVIIQAAAVGKPIVTFNVDGAWEIVEDGKNGFIVPMKDVNMMTEKIKILINDKELRKKMGAYSKTKVGNQWTIDNMVKETDKLYQELLS
ncbi:MAG: glycosyltransferase family 4 protein [Bacillota bacterium]